MKATLSLVPLLVGIWRNKDIKEQLRLLSHCGCVWKVVGKRRISDHERVQECATCHSVRLPWGPYGDFLKIECTVYGYQLRFVARELWAGGGDSLERVSRNSEGIGSIRCMDRLQFKGFGQWSEIDRERSRERITKKG
jgi:hypothetical protein